MGIVIKGVDDMFKYDLHHCTNDVCPQYDRPWCRLIHNYDNLQAVCSVFDGMNISQYGKRAMKKVYHHITNKLRVDCVDEEIKACWPVEEDTDKITVAICNVSAALKSVLYNIMLY